jgi:hypothetical protein
MRGFARLALPGVMLFVLATCWIWALANVTLVTADWEFDDVRAYLGAAQRLIDGGPLYITSQDASDLFLYAPWFAAAWVPFTALPTGMVEAGWAVILLLALAVTVWPFRRSWAGVALVLLLGGLLYRTVGWGNIQPLIVALLVYALPTRAGPWAVGVAGSLKPWPLLAVGVYAWRREWRSVAISLGTAAALWLPIFLFNWQEYPLGARPPNIYDATFLLAAPGLLRPDAFRVLRGRRAGSQAGTGAGAAD